jgi:tetratricopeptide (TPR) repeat protein
MGSWPEIVANASTRFRSRAFLELLVETARSTVRNGPREAQALTALVPKVLNQAAADARQPWARILQAKAAAHRANALRVAGDLPAAERAFAELRRELELFPLAAAVEAELASLEASLRIDQRRFAEADKLLAVACSSAGRRDSRLLIQRANLLSSMGRTEEALASYESAAAVLDPSTEARLRPIIVSGRVNSMCHLGRYEEARRLLAAEGDAFAVETDAHAAALHRLYSARIAQGLGELEAAVEGFASSRDQFLALDRDYDAVSTSLYLADTLLAAGKTAELRGLAADLVPLFRSRGVERETLASLRLLAEAAKAETLTAALLTELRRKLDGRTRAEPRGADQSES